MRAKNDGSVIIVSSIGGKRASTVIGAYRISKAADMQLARNLAADIQPPQHPRQHHRRPAWCGTDFARALGEDLKYLEEAPGDGVAQAHRRARRHRRHRRHAGWVCRRLQ